MEICRSVGRIKSALSVRLNIGHTTGFVPTMGALHDGHKSLLLQARQENDCVIASIFVNPTQFNDKGDLVKYLRPIEADISLLHSSEADYLFYPHVDEIYPIAHAPKEAPDLGGLDKVMEGIHRQGHFDGVAQVVKRLLDIVDPTRLYMGQKDFQQQVIIQHILEWYKMPTELRVCPIIRESNGLARSSRNERLTMELRSKASIIFQSLNDIKLSWGKMKTGTLLDKAIQKINNGPFKVEYIEVVDGETLQYKEDYSTSDIVVVCAAVWAEDVRLIDNVILKDTNSIYQPQD